MNLIKITLLAASHTLDADDLACHLIDLARNCGTEAVFTTHRQTEEAEEWDVPHDDDPEALEQCEELLTACYPSAEG